MPSSPPLKDNPGSRPWLETLNTELPTWKLIKDTIPSAKSQIRCGEATLGARNYSTLQEQWSFLLQKCVEEEHIAPRAQNSFFLEAIAIP